jgi:inosose dehydratase
LVFGIRRRPADAPDEYVAILYLHFYRAHLDFNRCPMNRRHFVTLAATATVAASLPPPAHAATRSSGPHVASNTYPWGTFAKREGRAFPLHTDESLAMIAASGVTGYEPNMASPADFDGLAARLQKHRLEMRSLYVNSVLHDPAQAEQSTAEVMAIARRAAETNTRIIVTNPSPIRWGGEEHKSDEQLIHQARALDRLGAALRQLGLTLAYHNHDVELRLGAREYHHMLTATDPQHVKFCLDAHWVFRGCGNSQVALFDTLELYGSRIVELHLRQSRNGVWTEVFTAEGDIDYGRLAAWLQRKQLKPHLVLEQAVEPGSPQTLEGVAAHQQSLANARRLFAAWA